MLDVNFLAVIVAAVVYIGVGAIWYSPGVFGRIWMDLAHKSEKDLKEGALKAYVGAFVLGLIIAFVLANLVNGTGVSTILDGASLGFWAWLGFCATTLFGGVLWDNKPLNLFFIHAGCYLVSYVLMGALLAAWQ